MIINPFRFGSAVTYATWNPSDKSASIDLSGGNRIATRNVTNDTTFRLVRATVAGSSPYYIEFVVDNVTASGFAIVGLAPSTLALTTFPGSDSASWGYYQDNGNKVFGGAEIAFGSSFKTVGDRIGLAHNPGTGKLWFRLNGIYPGGGDPAAGTGEAFSGLSGTLFPALSLYRTPAQITGCFDPTTITGSVPSGFTAGLPA